MINRIKNKIKKLKLKIHIILREEYGNKEILEKNNKEKKKIYLKKVICNPIKIPIGLIKKRFNIEYIEIVLTTTCTLKCKGCSALMEHYKKQSHTNIDINIESLKKILDCCDTLQHLRLLGGEPLCYPDLFKILEFTKQQDKIKRITIVTNGTLLIKDKQILEILKNDKFDVFISNYGSFSRKKEELINELRENNIKYKLNEEDILWRDYGNLEFRNRSKKELKNQFLNCKVTCNSLYNGKLHHCPRSTHGTNLKKIPLKEQDYINVLDKNITKKQLRKKLYKFFYGYVPYIEACNYCNSATKDLKLMPAGQQSKK